MSDLHKALTEYLDDTGWPELNGEPVAYLADLRDLLATHPPQPPMGRDELAKVIEDAWQRGDSDVDAILAALAEVRRA